MINDLLSWRESVARQAKRCLHNECIGLPPFRRLGGFSWTEFEVAGVEQRFFLSEKEELRRTKDVTGGQERYIGIVNASLLAERQDVFDASAGHSRLQQTRGTLRKNDLFVRRDVIAMRVRDESEALGFPGIEPQVLRREVNSALVTNLDH